MFLCILRGVTWYYFMEPPSLNYVCKLWARIHFKVLVEQSLPAENWSVTHILGSFFILEPIDGIMNSTPILRR